MSDFDSLSYEKVPNFLDADTTETISLYMKNIVHRGVYNGENSEDVICAYKMYADPLIEILLENMRPRSQVKVRLVVLRFLRVMP